MKSKRSVLLAMLMVVALLGMMVPGPILAEEPEEIKIGVLCPLTGKIAAIGEEQKNAVEMAIEEINAEGGILGATLTMQLEDDEMKPELAASMTQKLINDGVDVIIGGMSSSSTMAGGPIANSKEVLMISPWSTNPMAAEGDWVFRACFSDEFQGAIQAKYLAEGVGCKKPAQLLDVSDDGSKGQGEVVAATLEELGVPFVTIESYGAGDRDFKAQLTKIKSMEPDCLDTPNYYGEVALIRSQMKEIGLDIPHIGGDGVDHPDFFEIAGPDAEGMMITTHYSPEDPRPAVKAFRETYEEKYGAIPASTAALSYDAVMLYKMAAENAGSLDKYAIKDALAGLTGIDTLVTAPMFSMDETGTGIKSLAIVEGGADGEWHFKDVVNPASAAGAEEDKGPVKDQQEELKIGVLCPLTGKIAAIGEEQKNAVEMAIEEINAEGGILGATLTMQLEDDEMKPELAASMTQKLINDGVDVIIGGMSSSSTMAGGPIANSKEVLMISPWSTNPMAAEGDWVFRACFSDEFQGAIQAKYLAEGVGCKKPAQLLDVSDDGSKGQGEVVAATLEELGVPFVTIESYGAGDRDFKAQLTKIKSMEPDCLDTPNYYGEVALIRSQMKEIGLDIPHIGGDGVDHPDFFEIAGPDAEGMMITTHYSPEDPRPAVKAFRETYEEKYGAIPASTAALSYDAVMLYKMAAENANSHNPDDIRQALAELKDVDTLVTAPMFSMDETGTGIKSLAIVEGGADGEWHFKDVVSP